MIKKMVFILVVLFLLAITIIIVLSHPKFGRKPSQERLERIKNSPNYRDGAFQNRSHTPVTTTNKSMLKNMWDFFLEKDANVKPKFNIPTIKTDLHSLDKNDNILIWFGHSSYLIQSGGVRFLVDPVLTTSFPMKVMTDAFSGTDLYTPDDIPDVDILIITHEHWDHLDYGTIKSIQNRVGKVVCGLGLGEYFEYWGFAQNNIIEMDWNDTYLYSESIKIHALPARHYSNRLFKRNRTLWLSLFIEGQQNIFISGDGGYDTHFKEIGDNFPNIDLAIVENGQYGEGWRYIHTMPDELHLVVNDLNPKSVVTSHNSKFALARHSWSEPLENSFNMKDSIHAQLIIPVIGQVVHFEDTITDKWW